MSLGCQGIPRKLAPESDRAAGGAGMALWLLLLVPQARGILCGTDLRLSLPIPDLHKGLL